MSKDLFRLALEDEAAVTAEPTVVLKGPLSAIYAQALNIAYAKADPATGEVQEQATMESQANDALVAQQAAELLSGAEQPPEAHLTVYGVSASEITNDTVVDLTTQLAQSKTHGTERDANNRSSGDFFLIIDGTQPGGNSETSGNPTERMVTLGQETDALIPVDGSAVGDQTIPAPVAEVAPANPVVPGADSTQDGVGAEVAALTAAMECMVLAHGGKVFRSLAESGLK